MKRNKTITILVSASQMGEVLNNHESITGDFSDAKKVKWLNDLSKSDCFSDPRSLVLWQHYLIAFKITHVAFLNYDLTLLEGTIPTIWSLSALPKVFKAPSTGRTEGTKNNPRAVPAAGGSRDRAKVLFFTQITQRRTFHSTGWHSEIPPSCWEMLSQSPPTSLPLRLQLFHQPGWVLFPLSISFRMAEASQHLPRGENHVWVDKIVMWGHPAHVAVFLLCRNLQTLGKLVRKKIKYISKTEEIF